MNLPSPALIPAFAGGEIPAYFTRRTGGISEGPFASLNLGSHAGDAPEKVGQNWRLVLDRAGLPERRLLIPRLVHGDGLLDADTAGEGSGQEADAVCTGSRGLVLAVTAADCLPILVWDPAMGTIAAVHAGWRGTGRRILAKTLERLRRAGRLDPRSTRLAFGPCIQAAALELRDDAMKLLPGEFLRRRGDAWTFDLPAANMAQAIACGVPETNLRAIRECTYSLPDRYFSYRRDGAVSGRMAALIALP